MDLNLLLITMQSIDLLNQQLVDGEISELDLWYLADYYSTRYEKVFDDWMRCLKINNKTLRGKLSDRLDSAYNDYICFVQTMVNYLIFKLEGNAEMQYRPTDVSAN